MSQLISCHHCRGLNPDTNDDCVHCEVQLTVSSKKRVSRAWALAGAGVASITLMACYGMPPMCQEPGSKCGLPDCTLTQSDGGPQPGCLPDGGWEPVDGATDGGTAAGTDGGK